MTLTMFVALAIELCPLKVEELVLLPKRNGLSARAFARTRHGWKQLFQLE